MAKKAAAPKKTSTILKKTNPKKAKAKTDATPVLSDGQIGETAGLVWKGLLENGPQTAAALKKRVAASGDMVMAAVGWLAREGKLEFEVSGRTVKIALR